LERSLPLERRLPACFGRFLVAIRSPSIALLICAAAVFLAPLKVMALKSKETLPMADNKTAQQAGSLVFNGANRTFYVHLPAGYDRKTPLPLIFAFHGGGGKADMMNKLTNLNALADEKKVIVVYPAGLKRHWNDGRGVAGRDIDDVGFIAALLKQLENDYPIDSKRIYATGISNGGFFSQYLAIKMPGKLAAIASVAASTGVPIHDQETPPNPIPILFILGMKDPLVPWAGGEIRIAVLRRGFVVSAAQSADYWAKANHCTAPPVVTEKTFADGEKVFTKTFKPAADGADVVQIGIEDGGHCWPGGWQYLPARFIGKTSANVQATKEIWNFFNANQLR